MLWLVLTDYWLFILRRAGASACPRVCFLGKSLLRTSSGELSPYERFTPCICRRWFLVKLALVALAWSATTSFQTIWARNHARQFVCVLGLAPCIVNVDRRTPTFWLWRHQPSDQQFWDIREVMQANREQRARQTRPSSVSKSCSTEPHSAVIFNETIPSQCEC